MLAAIIALGGCTSPQAVAVHRPLPAGTVPPSQVAGQRSEVAGPRIAAQVAADGLPEPARRSIDTPVTGASASQTAEPTAIAQTILPAPPIWSGGVLSRAEVRTLFVETGWPAEAIDYGVQVVFHTAVCPNGESGGNPLAVSPWGDWGLMQINAATWAYNPNSPWYGIDPHEWLDPRVNLADALVIYERAGSFSPWSCAAGTERSPP